MFCQVLCQKNLQSEERHGRGGVSQLLCHLLSQQGHWWVFSQVQLKEQNAAVNKNGMS